MKNLPRAAWIATLVFAVLIIGFTFVPGSGGAFAWLWWLLVALVVVGLVVAIVTTTRARRARANG